MYLFWHVVYRPYGQQSQSHSQGFTSPPPPKWVTGDNASSSTSFACELLALSSLTHTLKDLPLPLWATRNDASHSTPFAYSLLVLWVVTLPTHSRIYLRHAKWEALTWLVVTKTGNHMSQRQGNHTSQRLGNHQ